MNNRNTTVAGIGSILVAVGSVLTALFDGDPLTLPDYATAVAAILAGVGLVLAKDAKRDA
jgi:Trk-type K+ transport system membrane component